MAQFVKLTKAPDPGEDPEPILINTAQIVSVTPRLHGTTGSAILLAPSDLDPILVAETLTVISRMVKGL